LWGNDFYEITQIIAESWILLFVTTVSSPTLGHFTLQEKVCKQVKLHYFIAFIHVLLHIILLLPSVCPSVCPYVCLY
jgi:hypothetical protein